MRILREKTLIPLLIRTSLILVLLTLASLSLSCLHIQFLFYRKVIWNGCRVNSETIIWGDLKVDSTDFRPSTFELECHEPPCYVTVYDTLCGDIRICLLCKGTTIVKVKVGDLYEIPEDWDLESGGYITNTGRSGDILVYDVSDFRAPLRGPIVTDPGYRAVIAIPDTVFPGEDSLGFLIRYRTNGKSPVGKIIRGISAVIVSYEDTCGTQPSIEIAEGEFAPNFPEIKDSLHVAWVEEPLEVACSLLTPIVRPGGNLLVKLTVTNNNRRKLPGILTFTSHRDYDCRPGRGLLSNIMTKKCQPGVTEWYYSLKVPTRPGPHSLSITFHRRKNGLFGLDQQNPVCCMDFDVAEIAPWRKGSNFAWELLEMSPEQTRAALPPVSSLAKNYPNPFNANTEIIYTLAEAGDVSLTIYNLGGQLIETLVYGHQDVGEYRITWDASDYSSGLYFYNLTTGDFTDTRRMTLVK